MRCKNLKQRYQPHSYMCAEMRSVCSPRNIIFNLLGQAITGTASGMRGQFWPWTSPSAWAETHLAPSKLGAPSRAKAARLCLRLSPRSSAFLIHLCLCLVLPHSRALERTQRDPRRHFQGSSAPARQTQLTCFPDWLKSANTIPTLTQPCS